MKTNHILLLALGLLIVASCTRNKEELPIVTKQIQYLVQLKNPDTIPDTRHKYMDDSTRLPFVKNIIDQVLAGDVKAYTYGNEKFNQASTVELKKRFAWDKSVPVPDSIDEINFFVDINRITKIRYFEEWAMDKKSLVINKRVLGIILMLDDYDETGMYRGFEPLFYIFYDKDYQIKLEELYRQ